MTCSTTDDDPRMTAGVWRRSSTGSKDTYPPDRSILRPRAIFWFRWRAEPMIRRFWNLAGVLKELDYEVRILKTARPGYVLYEDDDQVGAIPFRDTF